ncbi:unnamed protein product [Brachionus calyciflorus]|uniref:RING-type E3 ubiquitin transferase BRCA1 n=1 Tax=Brachionus calyciflorus TaxID=104777 RepID=A0A813ZNF2_9BILA|nr:unnamed protein product [Brachionus calyciflorus]
MDQLQIEKKQIDKLSSTIHLVKKSFECTICMDFFDDPVITNCQHAFCKKCIENYIGTKRTQSCPLCKNSINLRSLKKFSSLNPYILKTKQLEEIFVKELDNLKNINKKENQPESISKSIVLNEKVPSPIAEKRKKRTLSTDEHEKSTKKIKSNVTDLNNPMITSTRQEAKLTTANLNEITIIEDTMVIDNNNQLRLHNINNIMPNDKVEEWLDKNQDSRLNKDSNDCENDKVETRLAHTIEPNVLVINNQNKSSISIQRIERVNEDLNQILTKKINQKENFKSDLELPILNSSIDELSTDPNNMNKKDFFLINDAEINSNLEKINDLQKETPKNDLSKIDFVEKFKLRFPSKSYFCKELHIKKFNPLKFTNDITNRTGVNNNTMRHKSDSNLSLTLNTTPKMNRSNLLKLPKSVEPKLRAEYEIPNDPPLPIINLSSPKKQIDSKDCDSMKKSVRFKNQTPNLKRTQSDSNLSQSSQQITISCLTCLRNKKRSTVSSRSVATNTEIQHKLVQKSDQSTQCNFDDILENSLIDFKKLDFYLMNRIYFILESEILNQILSEYFKSFENRENLQTVQSIPDSPPAQVTIIEDTLVLSHANANLNHNESQLTTNESFNRRSTTFLNNFSELLNNSANHSFKKSTRKDQKRKPSLEFINPNRFENDGSFLESSFLGAKKHYEIRNDTNQVLDYQDNRISNQNLIIEATPIKMDDRNFREDIREINETLSKSSNRLQAIIGSENLRRASIENKNENTIIFDDNKENSKENENPLVIADTISLAERKQPEDNKNELVDSNKEKDVFKEPLLTQSKKADFGNHSFFLNSLNVTNYNQNQTNLAGITQNNLSQNPKEIPMANDILGVSIANDTIADLSNTLVQTRPQKMTDSVPVQTNLSKKSTTETQLLTDSAFQVIENLCKDHYSIQNQTICEEPESSKRHALTNITNNSNKCRMEFAYSLLPAEMRGIINKYAENNGIQVVGDITETTTHLIVDADKNLQCGVTSKYLKALSRKIWIVSVAWILNCINSGQMIKPDKFEIKGDKSFGFHNGPINARTSSKLLFDSYEFLFIGEFLRADSVSLEDVTQLVILNGGIVRRKAKDFDIEDTQKKKIVIFDDKAKKISLKIVETLKQNNIDCVNKSWLIDSLACYKLRALSEYQTYDNSDLSK